jgi:uncharacterized membrane protein
MAARPMSALDRAAVGLAAAAVGAQIAYPLVSGRALDAVTAAVVALLALAALVHAAGRSPRFALGFFLATAGIGFAAEAVGTATGFPFGSYTYALDRLGPHALDVPLVVPLAWVGGTYPVWWVVSWLVRGERRWPARIALTALTVTGWDLYLDPQMVSAGYWTWHSGGPALPGLAPIPLTNFAGWFGVALLMAAALELLGRRFPVRETAPAVPVALFLWTWLGSALAHSVFLDLGELRFSAWYGLLGMGAAGVPLLFSLAAASRARASRQGPASGPEVTFAPQTGRNR